MGGGARITPDPHSNGLYTNNKYYFLYAAVCETFHNSKNCNTAFKAMVTKTNHCLANLNFLTKFYLSKLSHYLTLWKKERSMKDQRALVALTRNKNEIRSCELLKIRRHKQWQHGIVVLKQNAWHILTKRKIIPIKIGLTIKLNERIETISHCF